MSAAPKFTPELKARCDDARKRAIQFALMELPGQPRMMHMGTSYLVNDLALCVRDLIAALSAADAALARAEGKQ